MESICRKLYDVVCEMNLTDVYVAVLTRVFPGQTDLQNVMFSMSADKLHEVLLHIQLGDKRTTRLGKLCRRIEPFVIEARKDARAKLLTKPPASTGEFDDFLADAPVEPNKSAEVEPAPTPFSYDEWLAANIDKIRLWLHIQDVHNLEVDLYLATNNNLEILSTCLDKVLASNDGKKSQRAVHYAATDGHLSMVEWLIDNGYNVNSGSDSVMCNAAANGHKNIVELLYARGCPLSTMVFALSAGSGNLDLVKWLVAQNCPMSDDAFAYAVRKGSIEMLDYLMSINCPVSTTVMNTAITAGQLEVVKWLVAHGHKFNISSLYNAVVRNYRELVQYLVDNGVEWSNDAIAVAKSRGYVLEVKLISFPAKTTQ